MVLLSLVWDKPSGQLLGLLAIVVLANLTPLSSRQPKRRDNGSNRTNRGSDCG
jgi:hypothetical protein